MHPTAHLQMTLPAVTLWVRDSCAFCYSVICKILPSIPILDKCSTTSVCPLYPSSGHPAQRWFQQPLLLSFPTYTIITGPCQDPVTSYLGVVVWPDKRIRIHFSRNLGFCCSVISILWPFFNYRSMYRSVYLSTRILHGLSLAWYTFLSARRFSLFILGLHFFRGTRTSNHRLFTSFPSSSTCPIVKLCAIGLYQN